MSMNASSKKSIPLSVYDRSRLVTEHATRSMPMKSFWTLVTTYQQVTLSRLTYQTDTNCCQTNQVKS